MNNTRFGLIFYFKKPKAHTGTTLPVYMRISMDNQRAEMSTQRKWDPSRWSVEAGRAIGKQEDARSLNAYLDTLQSKVYEAQRQLIANEEEVTVFALKELIEGKKKEKARMLIEIFKHHNSQLKQLVDKDFAPGTLERYETALSHTVDFLKWKYKVTDIDILELSYEFATEFEFWLKSVRNCNHNTSIKYVSNLKKIVNICLKNGWLPRDPFIGYKMNKREVIRDVLSQEDIDVLIDRTFATNRLEVIRDLFLFSCYTGLAYADVKKLKRSEVATGVDGGQWIFTKRQKTEAPSRIPLLPHAKRILAKYDNHPLCLNRGVLLPVPSNQKMNDYLREIATLCGITKKMTFHTARHTFATTITLTNGVPIETVGKMLGHRNLKTTQHYAKIVDKKVSDDMDMLRRKLDARGESPIQ
jgi:site-specific recombinase XerD